MILFAFQWMMAQLAKVGLKIPGVATTESSDAKGTPEKPSQHRIDNNICDELWCFCKSLTGRGRKGSSASSVASISESSSSEGSDSESDDGEEADQPDHPRQEQKGQTRRRKRQTRQRRTSSSPVMPFNPGEWCMPCTEIIK